MGSKKLHVRTGDLVKVVAGNQKGLQGKILQVDRNKERAVVEGVCFIKKHVRRSQDQPNGGIVEREGAVHVSNLKLIERPSPVDRFSKKKD